MSIPYYNYQPYPPYNYHGHPYPQQPSSPTSYSISYVLNVNGTLLTNGTTWLNWIQNNNPDLFNKFHSICFQKVYLISDKCVISISVSYYFNSYYYVGNPLPPSLTITPLAMLEEPDNLQFYDTGYVPMYNKQNVDWNNKTLCTTLLY